jgi:putative ABC transport system substrate-binding protein
MRRRSFITLIGGAAATWPLAARGQGDRARRIGIIVPAAADDPEFRARVGAFLQELALLGWSIGRNLQVDERWAGANPADIRRHAAQLAVFGPDVILAHGALTVRAMLQETRTLPIVFATAADPVGDGLVDSLARPGGNATGFLSFEYSFTAKWLEMLKEIAPAVTRAAVLQAPSSVGSSQFAVIQAMAPALRMEVRPLNVSDDAAIERAIEDFAHTPNSGLIVTATAPFAARRDLIVKLARQHKLPAIYFDRAFVAAGGLISYGIRYIDQYRLAAGYVDRILRGEKPADLPVQAPTKYELVINLKTAKALGLTVPPTLFARADEIIE